MLEQRDHREVHRDQAADRRRQNQHVHDVEPRLERLGAGERAAPDRQGNVRADERDRERHRVCDREAHAAREVVGQRVPREPLEDREREQRETDQVVQLARLAKRAGEEDPHQVEQDRRDEDERRPVVGLAHQQARAHLERQVERRGVGPAHAHPIELVVGAVVGRERRRRLEEERQVDAGRDQHDEAVERDLAEQERPVVGEDVAHQLDEPGRGAGTAVERAQPAADHAFTLHHAGPIGPDIWPAASRWPSAPTRSGSWGSGRPAGPKVTVPPVAGSKVE